MDTQQEVAALVERAQGGDREAYGELYVRFRTTTCAQLRRYGRGGDAEDLVQQAFVHAFERLPQLRAPERFPGWLKTLAIRLALRQMSRRRREEPFDAAQVDWPDARTANPLSQVIRDEARGAVRQALAQLYPRDRALLEGRYFEGRSLAALSATTAASTDVVKRHLHRARQRLAAVLQ